MERDATKQPASTATRLEGGDTVPATPTSLAFERHFSVQEIAAIWGLSEDVVREMFQNQPGVLVLGDPNARGKRRYVTLRIPQSVVERVHRKYSLSSTHCSR